LKFGIFRDRWARALDHTTTSALLVAVLGVGPFRRTGRLALPIAVQSVLGDALRERSNEAKKNQCCLREKQTQSAEIERCGVAQARDANDEC
jgi:hypothetical protein